MVEETMKIEHECKWRSRRFAAASLLMAGIAAASLLVVFGLLTPNAAHAVAPAAPVAQDDAAVTNTTPVSGSLAHVVVQLDSTRRLVRPITFTAPISGLAALQSTGLSVTVAETSFGPAVCAIEGVGCPADNCFCDASRFWSYSTWDGTQWQAYQVGASQSVISTTGAVEGWRWGEGDNPAVPAPQALAAANALAWLRSQQDATTAGYGDGLGGAVEVMLAMGANDEKIAAWQPVTGTRTLADFVRLRATRYSRQGVAEAGKLAVAAVAAGGCRTVRSLQPSAYFSDTLAAYAPDSGFNAWGILGTLALSQTVPPSAVDALAAQQQSNGGWEWQPGFGTDTNTTAVAVQTLVTAGYPVTATEVVSGLAFLKTGQVAGGGFVYDPATPENGPDANSTAYALMALWATGEDAGGEAWSVDGGTAAGFLLSLQQPDGSLEWQAGTGPNLLATAQAATALMGRSYPLAVGTLGACRR
jgi:hypothetical protein